MKYVNSPNIPDPPEYNFKKGDLIVPNLGLRFAFVWEDGLVLNDDYIYHKASDAEYHLFWDRMIHGYNNFGYENSDVMLKHNKEAFVKK